MPRVERIILCGGVPPPPRARRENILKLRLGDADDEIRLKISDITNRLAAELPHILTDLVEVATYIYCADQAVTRGGDGVVAHGRDWRRRFSFHIPVRALDVWSSDAVRTVLRDTLGFLSDDDYEFHFYGYKNPVPMQTYLELVPGSEGINEIDEVLPFSGGADSTSGAVLEAARDGRRVVLVSHRANPKISRKQKQLVEDLRARCAGNKPMHIPVWVQKGLVLDREYTQRTRSFLYAALAAVVALAFGRRRIRFYENGVVSLNLPISEQVVGCRATRTTHPQVLSGYASLFGLLTDGAFEVENGFLWLTKSEVIDLLGDAGCAELIKHTVSCTHTRDMTQIFTHCGNCSQCVNRRFATLASKYGDSDPAEMYKVDLLVGEREKNSDITLLESYIRIAAEMKAKNEYQLLERFGEMSRILRHVRGLTADQVAERIVRLHQKHAEEVHGVLRSALSHFSAEILGQELPRTCAIIMAFPEIYRTAGASDGGQDRPQSAKPVRKPQRKVYRFGTPAGTNWPDISIRFLDGHTVTISVDSRAERYTFAEMNMKDGRNGNPTKQWKLLERLAQNGGRIAWSNSAADVKAKKQVELLAHRLQEYFGIKESPFEEYRKGAGWQIKLRLEAPR
jgi:7-cyano-7-deazaguanine synthase in queuosine biosynthesis